MLLTSYTDNNISHAIREHLLPSTNSSCNTVVQNSPSQFISATYKSLSNTVCILASQSVCLIASQFAMSTDISE